MSNRVEELESQVSELRAAVDGLTEELVETKERLRQLEAATDAEPTVESYANPEETAETTEPEAEEAKSTEEKAQRNESESDESDIIVA